MNTRLLDISTTLVFITFSFLFNYEQTLIRSIESNIYICILKNNSFGIKIGIVNIL